LPNRLPIANSHRSLSGKGLKICTPSAVQQNLVPRLPHNESPGLSNRPIVAESTPSNLSKRTSTPSHRNGCVRDKMRLASIVECSLFQVTETCVDTSQSNSSIADRNGIRIIWQKKSKILVCT
jgi:hypothetical protein